MPAWYNLQRPFQQAGFSSFAVIEIQAIARRYQTRRPVAIACAVLTNTLLLNAVGEYHSDLPSHMLDRRAHV
ncbi:hypothetical protein AMS68_006654 [Peltaster fructicola]|uniref:Uncharacterized protein n=1 Tax=Peltaster fructicola TaxID=286661 RepID=A0A6H0Y2B6_9PEZI|nr:hypothetical protein AMS68_006654 [Peltaster fructicola]